MNGADPTAGVTPPARRMTVTLDDRRLTEDYLPPGVGAWKEPGVAATPGDVG